MVIRYSPIRISGDSGTPHSTPQQDSPHRHATLHAAVQRFSRKIENLAAAVALNYFANNFVRIHRTLRMSPAMAAGVTDRLFAVSDLVTLLEAEERESDRAA